MSAQRNQQARPLFYTTKALDMLRGAFITTLLTFSILMLPMKNLWGQVSSRAYSIMLNGLLSESVELLSAEELEKRMEEVILLDTRQWREYEVSHLQNARWVGYDDFSKAKVKDLPRDKPIVVYCSVGARSETIGEKLLEMGFERVYNLHGGIFEWVNAGQPVYDQSGAATPKVHAYSKLWGVWLSKGEKVYD